MCEKKEVMDAPNILAFVTGRMILPVTDMEKLVGTVSFTGMCDRQGMQFCSCLRYFLGIQLEMLEYAVGYLSP